MKIVINPGEASVLRTFRTYKSEASAMLFFNGSSREKPSSELSRALKSLVSRGLIRPEKHPDAFSLTDAGYHASLSY